MFAPRPTAFAGELAKLGLDVTNLPKLDDLQPKQLRDVMELIKQSVAGPRGRCLDCHVDEYKAPTRRKKIAKRMWDDFVSKLSLADGGPVFCDSCHQDGFKQLDRGDKQALAKAMDENFVTKLRRKDGQGHRCTTCHVSFDDYALFDKWSR